MPLVLFRGMLHSLNYNGFTTYYTSSSKSKSAYTDDGAVS